MAERTKLKAARLERGLSQSELASIIRCSREALSLWERGGTDPHSDYIVALCTFFRKSPVELDLAQDLTEGDLYMIEEILKNKALDRRQALSIIALPAFARVDLASLSKPLVSPGAFLIACKAVIKSSWYLLEHNGFIEADTVLSECMPTLVGLAVHSSEYQEHAAHLAIEAKIIQGISALHHLDYARQESLYLEALDIGKQAGNDRLQAVPLTWLGWLYESPRQLPERGIPFYNDALTRLGSDALFQRSECMYGLSRAYSLSKRKGRKALDLLLEAKATMPKNYVQDAIDRLLDTRGAQVEEMEGVIYQNLHKIFPQEGYARTAYEIFERATKQQTLASRVESELLICQADAACDIGDLREYVKCLEKGMDIALQINSLQRKKEAQKVLGRVPNEWRSEAIYKNLVKMF